MKRQASTAHPDPVHVTAHFLAATVLSSFEVHVQTIKTRKTLTNIQADFYQRVSKVVALPELNLIILL